VPLTSLAAGQLICACAELLLLTPTSLPHPARASAVLAVASLGVVGTGAAYVLSYSLLRDRGATVTSSVNYPIPAIAAAEGVLLLGEPLRWNQPLGAVLVLAGVALVSVPARRAAAA
jgi:drug/metabolite transporter (DMT)-like permease